MARADLVIQAPDIATPQIKELARLVEADAIVARPGWTAVMFPPIPLGSGGANEIGGKYRFPGTYAVRPATLRAVFMDLAAELGEQGFGWVFIVHGHGSPDHNRMLDQAGAFFHDSYGGQMVHLRGFMEAPDCCRAGPDMLSPAAKREDGFSVHADIMEHSRILYLRPDLVPASIAQAPARTGRDFAELSSWPAPTPGPVTSERPPTRRRRSEPPIRQTMRA